MADEAKRGLSKEEVEASADLINYVLRQKYPDAKPVSNSEARSFIKSLGFEIEEPTLRSNKYVETDSIDDTVNKGTWVARAKKTDLRMREPGYDQVNNTFDETADEFNKSVYDNIKKVADERKALCELAVPILGDRIRKKTFFYGVEDNPNFIKVLNGSRDLSVGFSTLVLNSGDKPVRVHYLWSHENKEGLLIKVTPETTVDPELKDVLSRSKHTYVSAYDKDAEKTVRDWMDRNYKDNPRDFNFAFMLRNSLLKMGQLSEHLTNPELTTYVESTRDRKDSVDLLLNKDGLKSRTTFPVVITKDQSRMI